MDHIRRDLSRELRYHNRHRRSAPLPKKAPIQEVPQSFGERIIRHEDRRLPNWRPIRPLRPARFDVPPENDPSNSSQVLRLQTYTWGMSISECSVSCGGGTRVVRVFCHVGWGHVVEESFCSKKEKPAESGVQACNHQPCIGRYDIFYESMNGNAHHVCIMSYIFLSHFITSFVSFYSILFYINYEKLENRRVE